MPMGDELREDLHFADRDDDDADIGGYDDAGYEDEDEEEGER